MRERQQKIQECTEMQEEDDRLRVSPQLVMRVTAVQMQVIDELRRKERDLPSRPEMVRRLIDRAAGLPEGQVKQGRPYATS